MLYRQQVKKCCECLLYVNAYYKIEIIFSLYEWMTKVLELKVGYRGSMQ